MGIGRSGGLTILVLVPFAPRFDSPHGGRATAEFLIRLARRHDLALLCLRAAGEPTTADELQEVCVLVEEVELPRRRRVRSLAQVIRGVPMQVTDWWSMTYAQRVTAVAASLAPDVVHFEPLAMARYLDYLEASAAADVVVTHEPVTQTAREVFEDSRGVERLVRRLDLRAWRRFEKAAIARVDAVVVLTERDRQALAARTAGRRLVRIPLGVEIPALPLDPLGVPPPSLLFVGGYGHPPNVDAALRLARGILPRVREHRPDAVLRLLGDRPPDAVRELAGDGVVVPGRVPDVRPFLDAAAVVVAPLRLGGGMRNKVLEALAAGKAVVASPLAAAGLAAEALRLADGDAEFAAAIVELLEDDDARRDLARRARAWAEAHLAWDDRVEAFETLYRSLASDAPRTTEP